ncbi:MAG: VanZ family protein [Aeromicrobium sp.]|uniref:VanZ family protein n=1 Tax=Aeromicrobium sp. TaxID=1871063 RepID=UPI0039E31032
MPTRQRTVLLVLFACYLLALLFLLILPNADRGQNVMVGGLTWDRWTAYVANGWNLVPLWSIADQIGAILAGDGAARDGAYLVGNLVGFAPLGYFLPALFVRQRQFTVFVGTVVAALFCLELAQLLTMRGSFDIDDVLLNAVGAGAGFWLTRRMWPDGDVAGEGGPSPR